MAKLIAGEKVKQMFEVTLSFKAEEGDLRIKKNDILGKFVEMATSGGTSVAVKVKEVKQSF